MKGERGPVRVVCPVPKNWNGYCPECKRGADGFTDGIWCDCLPPKQKKKKKKV